MLPTRHPLAARGEIALADLAEEPFVLWPRSLSTRFYDEIIAACRARGFSPRIEYEGRGIETQLGLVAAGLGVSLQPASYANLARTGVAFRPLRERGLNTTLELAWRRADRSPALVRFLTAARDVGTRCASRVGQRA